MDPGDFVMWSRVWKTYLQNVFSQDALTKAADKRIALDYDLKWNKTEPSIF